MLSGLHAYIVTGRSEAARERLAFRLAREALCSGRNAPCGVCPDCRKAEARAHPDLHEVSPDERGTIRIDQARAMRETAQVKPNEAARHVFLVHSADTMNTAAQNALLAAIEEPPTPCVFILVCGNERALLRTVRSRCGVLRAEEDGGEDRGEDASAAASSLARALGGALRTAGELVDALSPLAALKSDEAVRRLDGARAELVRMAADDPAGADRALLGAELAARAEDMLRANVSAAQAAAWLAASVTGA